MAAAAPRGQEKKEVIKDDARPPTPFERFTDLARRIVTVPKAEIDKRAKVYARTRKKKRGKASHL